MAEQIRTIDYILSTIFPDGQGSGAITERDLRETVASIISHLEGGWVFYVDEARRLEVNAVAITGGTRTKILIDGAAAGTNLSQINLMGSTIWDVATSLMMPKLNCAYDIRLTFQVKTATPGTGNFIDIDLDIDSGGGGITIYDEIKLLAKGANQDHNLSVSLPLFTAAPFPTNGGAFFLTPNVNITLWDVRILIIKVYNPIV